MAVTVEFSGIDDLIKSEGQEDLIVSDYIEITQERINQFADATSDHQWIHIDAERAKKESPFGTTVAHGYLTLCMAPYFLFNCVKLNNLKMVINYGLNNMKLAEPVRVNSKLRMRGKLLSAKNLRGTIKATFGVVLETENAKKPSCTAELTTLFQFE